MKVGDIVWALWKYNLQRMGTIQKIDGDNITISVSLITYGDTIVTIHKSKILKNNSSGGGKYD